MEFPLFPCGKKEVIVPTKVMICVGEASGDLHGASVAHALLDMQPNLELFGMGGSVMREAGVEIIYDIAEIGVMGFVEVVWNIPKFFKIRKHLSQIMDEHRPDVILLIDYGGFNMKLAEVAKKKKIPVVYYICPKAWVWGKYRAKQIADTVERVASIFPFEADVYREAGAKVTFVGHPLVDIVHPTIDKQTARRKFNVHPDRPLILLLPGSRRQEVHSLLDVMLAAAQKIIEKCPECQFYLPVAPTISMEAIQSKVEASSVPVTLTQNGTYDLMQIADCAIAASGTVTLESALMGLPSVIIYKVKPLTYWLVKHFATVTHVGLPNIIAGRRVFPELIQDEATPEAICDKAIELVRDEACRSQALLDAEEVREKLGAPGAVRRVAKIVFDVANRSKI